MAVMTARYPMVAGTMSSVFDNKPPVIVFVNQAMAQLTQYSWVRDVSEIFQQILNQPICSYLMDNYFFMFLLCAA
jgi:hypothetical protein